MFTLASRNAALLVGCLALSSALPAASSGTLPGYEARFGRTQPVIAVVAYNPSTEVTDFVVPYGVLAESGVADVVAVSTGEGPIQMSAGTRFGAQATLAANANGTKLAKRIFFKFFPISCSVPEAIRTRADETGSVKYYS